MSNWIGLDRTNYFRVKNVDAFKAFIAKFDDVKLLEKAPDLFGLHAEDGEGWPSYEIDTDELMTPDFVTQVAGHVADDDVVVFVSAGSEKARYASGSATAFHKGRSVSISIDDIYDKAKQAFGIKPTEATY